MKKFIACILVFILTVSLTACGNKTGQEEVQKEPEATTETVAAEETEEVTEAETVPEETTEAAGETVTDGTVGEVLKATFVSAAEGNEAATAQELADAVVASESIPFEAASMPVEAGLLTGFGNAEIIGFSEGVMFAPMIGTIPFVGYVFTLEDGTDVDAFVQTLESNADPRWNICTEAEETVVEVAGNKVFFLMCPASFDESGAM